jgi:lipoate-protein ligase A
MKSATIRLLPFTTATGPDLMAGDEVLLTSASAGQASLRCYAWSQPTLSLGYFQPHAERRLDPHWAELPWLRRASGGAALVHQHELTYALAVPAGTEWQPRDPAWLCRFHGLISTTLLQFGVTVHGVQCGAERKLGPVLCFRHHTPGDLVLDGHKIVGSAQRKHRGALVQHGGILLAQSPHAPSLPGLRELAGVALTPTELATALVQTVRQALPWPVVAEDWTPTEQQELRRLVHEKYTTTEWNEKR